MEVTKRKPGSGVFSSAKPNLGRPRGTSTRRGEGLNPEDFYTLYKRRKLYGPLVGNLLRFGLSKDARRRSKKLTTELAEIKIYTPKTDIKSYSLFCESKDVTPKRNGRHMRRLRMVKDTPRAAAALALAGGLAYAGIGVATGSLSGSGEQQQAAISQGQPDSSGVDLPSGNPTTSKKASVKIVGSGVGTTVTPFKIMNSLLECDQTVQVTLTKADSGNPLPDIMAAMERSSGEKFTQLPTNLGNALWADTQSTLNHGQVDLAQLPVTFTGADNCRAAQ